MYGINSTVHQGLQCTPYGGRHRSAPPLDAVGRPDQLCDSDEDELRTGVDLMVQQTLEEAQIKYKARADASRRPAPVFRTRDRVMVRASVLQSKAESELLGHARKLRSLYVGPLPIVERINANAYRVQLLPGSRAHDVINVQHLERYRPSDTYERRDAPPPVMVANDGSALIPTQYWRTASAHWLRFVTPSQRFCSGPYPTQDTRYSTRCTRPASFDTGGA